MSLCVSLPAALLNERAGYRDRPSVQVYVLPSEPGTLTPPAPSTKQDVDQIGQVTAIGAGCGQGGNQPGRI